MEFFHAASPQTDQAMQGFGGRHRVMLLVQGIEDHNLKPKRKRICLI